jgi:hypothetical protein
LGTRKGNTRAGSVSEASAGGSAACRTLGYRSAVLGPIYCNRVFDEGFWLRSGLGREVGLRRGARALGGLIVVLGMAFSAFGLTPTASAAPLPKFGGAAWVKGLGPTHLSSPVIADVNGDGHPDVVTADLSGMLHVLDGRTGRDLPGWPQPVQVNPGQTVAVESSPTVASLDHNGHMQIVVGAGTIDIPGQQGGVVAFNANGSVRWRIRTMTIAGESGVVGSPAVGDVNGDGFPDVVFGSFDHRIYAVDRSGRLLPGFPIDSLDTIWDSPALYDEAHIGRMDIFLGGDASPGGPCGAWSWAGILRAIRVTPSGPRVLWSHCQHQIFQSSPAIGNISYDGRMDVVVGTGTGASGDARATNSLSAFHLDDGSPVAGWPVVLNGPIFGSPVIGDVNGDGRNDVVVAACATCNDGRVWAFSGHGHLLWDVVPGAAENDHTEILSTPILVDLNGDGVNDVAIGQAGEFYFLRGRDGARMYQPIEVNRIVQDSAAVADFGPGVGWRMIIQSWHPQGSGLPKDGSARIESFPLPKAPAVAPAWPQWRLNAAHTASPPAPLPPAHTGYWTVSVKGGVYTYGNARNFGSTGKRHLLHPIVGMAPTPSGHGYWLVTGGGDIYNFGDAKLYGSAAAQHPTQPVVGIVATRSGHGYWLVTRGGGIYNFGDANFYGSTGAEHLKQPVVGIAAAPSGRGYWLVTRGGGVINFGDAKSYGSPLARHSKAPITGIAATRSGHGYWVVAANGHVYHYGDAHTYRSNPRRPLPAQIVALSPTPSGRGYWLVARNGNVYAAGDARAYFASAGLPPNQPIIAAAPSRHT